MNQKNITRQRDLRDATPLWAATRRISVITKKVLPSAVFDIVIVGAGISGALMADALADGQRSILVVDRRKPVTGSTMASTAMIQHEIDVPLHKLAEQIGASKACRVWRRSAAAVENLVERVGTLKISCGMERKKTLYLAGDIFGTRAFETEAQARHRAGIDVTLLSSNDLEAGYGIERTAGLLSNISASANPAQLTAGLLRGARMRNAVIVEGIEICDVRDVSDRVALATGDGRIIEAGHVVFCTGYEFLESLAASGHDVISTWALASRPGIDLPAWLSSHLVWEGSDPYLYFRTTSDGRLVVGGEDENDADAFNSPAKLARKSVTIVDKLESLLGMRIGKPDYVWSACFGTTKTGLPMIGQVPGMTNVHAVMGFGGNGITFSQIASEIVAAAIGGKPDPDADLFPFPS